MSNTNILSLFILILICFSACREEVKKKADSNFSSSKFHPEDPFEKTITGSQHFEFDSKNDKVIEGKKGTIVVCPKGCFLNSKGEIVESKVSVELAEALSWDEMIVSNLTTTADGKLLETDGMIFIEASANNEVLTINKENPIYIRIPTTDKKQGMSAYKGTRDGKGNMNWKNPKPLKEYLITMNLNLLDFVPSGFPAAVEGGMPYRKYKIATKELIDSLYYLLSVSDGSEYVQGFVNTNVNEAHHNKNKKIVNGKYTSDSYNTHETDTASDLLGTISNNYGIDPAKIKVIKSEKYQNTFIATKEFEARIKAIHRTCNDAVLEIYTKNLDKDLYVLDSLAEKMSDREPSHEFHDFYLQKKTNVKNADKYAKLLRGYYENQLLKIKSSLQTAKEKVVSQLKNKNKVAEKVVTEYKELLWEREKYRMETYGFEWSENGWINIDRGTTLKNWGPQRLEIKVQNSAEFDRVYCYVIYATINSLYRLNTDDNVNFYVGNSEEREMNMPKKGEALFIAIAYKNETAYYVNKGIITGTTDKLSLLPKQTSMAKIKEELKQFDTYSNQNKIDQDLVYMDQFFIEQKRQKKLIKESEFIRSLYRIAYPCIATAPAATAPAPAEEETCE